MLISECNPDRLKSCLRALQTLSMAFFVMITLASCSGGDQKTQTAEAGADSKTEDSATDKSAEDPDEILDPDEGVKKKSGEGKKKAQFSTDGKRTGVTTAGIAVQQENEVLGLTVVKVCKFGIRMDSPSITVVVPPGQTPMAFNSQNGTSLMLTERAASFMAGMSKKGGRKHDEELRVVDMGKETFCNKPCNHYRFIKILKDDKTKKPYDSWAEDAWFTKDVNNVPPNILNDCAKLVLLPTKYGFPVRIARWKNRAHASTDVSRLMNLDKSKIKDVIKSLSFENSTLDKGDFILPEGFKPAKDEMQFMMAGVEGDDELDTVLDDSDEQTVKTN